jgi:hypothetical protein
MTELRVTGLVRLMRWAQAQLAAGIGAEQAESFRSTIRQAIRQVDGLLDRYHAPASRLPRPSLQAYEYLKAVELDRLPPPKASPRKRLSPIGMCADIQEEMIAVLPEIRGGQAAAAAEKLLVRVQGAAKSAQVACARQGIHPHELPLPTRRAVCWLEFLSIPEMLSAHLQTLERLDRFSRQAVKGKVAVQVALSNTGVLYRMNHRGHRMELIVHEGFLGAPDEVLEALAGMALSRRSARRSQIMRAYAAGPDFLRLSQRLAAGEAPGRAAPETGDLKRLVEAFERINRDCFAGSLPPPALTWSRGRTYREFGHYQPASDTVSISRSLDDPAVPGYVLDFVMYHELLHKKLGVKTAGGRSYAHTAEFRREEQRFPRYFEAKACLQELSNKLTPKRRPVRRTAR